MEVQRAVVHDARDSRDLAAPAGLRHFQDAGTAALLVEVQRRRRVRRPASRPRRESRAAPGRTRPRTATAGGSVAGLASATGAGGASRVAMRDSAHCHPENAEMASSAMAAAAQAQRLGAAARSTSSMQALRTPRPVAGGGHRGRLRLLPRAEQGRRPFRRASSVVKRDSATVKSSSDWNGGRSSVPRARAMRRRSAPLARNSGSRLETREQRVQQRRRARHVVVGRAHGTVDRDAAVTQETDHAR